MKKRVNIYPRGPITSIEPPIRTPIKGVTKEITDIRKCIIAGAKVEEIISGTYTVNLNLNNYDKDNGGTLEYHPSKVRLDNAIPPMDENTKEPEEEEDKEIVTMRKSVPLNIPAPEDIKPPEKPKIDHIEDMVVENEDEEVEIAASDIENEPYKNMSKKQRKKAKAAARKAQEQQHQQETETAVEEPSENTGALNMVELD